MSVLEGEKKPEPKPVEPIMEKEVSDDEEVCVNDINEQLFSVFPSTTSVLITSTKYLIHSDF